MMEFIDELAGDDSRLQREAASFAFKKKKYYLFKAIVDKFDLLKTSEIDGEDLSQKYIFCMDQINDDSESCLLTTQYEDDYIKLRNPIIYVEDEISFDIASVISKKI